MGMYNKIFLKVRKALRKHSFIELISIVRKKILNKTYNFIIKYFSFMRHSHLEGRQFSDFNPKMKFFFNDEDKLNYFEVLKKQDLNKKVLDQAENVISHIFNLLGSGEVHLGEKINWHKDFKTGKVWNKTFYLDLQREIFDSNEYFTDNSDVKVPWELSRFQHISVLGQAFWLTGDEKYSNEFKNQMLDWINENPIYFGINWTCTMDVSIRAINMIIGYYYFEKSEVISKDFWMLYFKQLYISGRFIANNLECDSKGHGNNHYLSNISGLLWLGLFFGKFDKHTIRWVDIGVKEIISEMDYQVNKDGGSFEGSISYHRLSTEILLSSTILANKNDIEFSQRYMKQLEKMCEFIMDYTKPNGKAPLFGDFDDGRLHILGDYYDEDKTDHRHLLGVAAGYFDRDDFAFFAENHTVDSLWINGCIKKNNENFRKPVLKAYKETGIYIINHDELYMIIKCGGLGQHGNGGHDHNDQLSFEININGEDIIIDPGTYVYTADKDLRHLFRTTGYHNISQIDNLEQNYIKNECVQDLFNIYSSYNGVCDLFVEKDNHVYFRGHINIANSDIKYEREIKIDLIKREIMINDSFIGNLNNRKLCKSRLYFSENITAEKVGGKELNIDANNNKLKITSESEFLCQKGYVSKSYGVKNETNIVSFQFTNETTIFIYY